MIPTPTLLFDPANPASMYPPKVQFLIAGNTIQRNNRVADETVTQLGHGYGLRLDENNEVHSFRLLDGDTARWAIQERHGRPMLRQRHQFLPDEGYRYQPGLRNDSTGPNTDRLRNNGTRSRWNCIPLDADDPIGWSNSMGSGTGSRVVMATVVEVPPWVVADDLNACFVGMHATDGGPASPFTCMVGQGQLRIVHRDSRTPLAAGSPAPDGEWVGKPVDLSGRVGELLGVVIEADFDPIVGRFRCWTTIGDRWETVVDVSNGWGWGYAEDDPDGDVWGAILHGFYSWRSAGPGVAPLNWDTRFLTRDLWYGPAALFVDQDVTAADVGDWVLEQMAEPAPPPPPPDPTAGLLDRMTQLEERVEGLEAADANHRAGWSALADLARGVADGES